MSYNLVRNNGIGKIHNKLIPNCCLFISLATIWQKVSPEDYNFHKKIFDEMLEDDISGEEMVYAIIKVKCPEKLYNLGETQSDVLIEHFAKYSKLKLSVHFKDGDMKWDLFEGTDNPDGIIIQYNNHFDCAI
jgi:hypothetical protein